MSYKMREYDPRERESIGIEIDFSEVKEGLKRFGKKIESLFSSDSADVPTKKPYDVDHGTSGGYYAQDTTTPTHVPTTTPSNTYYTHTLTNVTTPKVSKTHTVELGYELRKTTHTAKTSTAKQTTKKSLVQSDVTTLELPKLAFTVSPKLNMDKLKMLERKIPSRVEQQTTSLIQKVYDKLAISISGSASYEEILRFFIEKSADVDSWVNCEGMIAFQEIVIDIYNMVSGDKIAKRSSNPLHIETITLSILWGVMILVIIKKACSSNPNSSQKSIVARGVIAVAVAFLQVQHKEKPEKSLEVISKAYSTIGDWVGEYPALYNILFPAIYIDTVIHPQWYTEIDKHIGEGYNKQINANKAINMSYTFRIGDSFVEGLGKSFAVDKDDIQNILYYIHPIPRQREITKLIRLYVEENIY